MARGYPDYEGNKAGVYLKSEWAAREGRSLVLSNSADTIVRGGGISAGMAVPAGKRWVINEVGGSSVSWNAADGELNQMCFLQLAVDGVAVLQLGGNGGAYAPLSEPIELTAGQLVGVALQNMANHDSSLFVFAHGYEVDV